ncbi:hypothetical protein EV360DRAFT_89286 [Lentinula raphanica]|nr:hypothetical protein EV360DRAFT_89286 [Lentinula raphanica]
MAPAVPDAKSSSFAYTSKMEASIHVDTANFKMVSDVLAADALKKSASCSEDFVGVGVDQELISSDCIMEQSKPEESREAEDCADVAGYDVLVRTTDPHPTTFVVRPKHYGKANNALTRFSTIVQTGSFAVNQTLTVTPLTSMYLCASSYLQTMTLENVNVHYPLL